VLAIGIAERRYKTTNMMLFNNGYDVTVMNTSTTQLTMQHYLQPVVSNLAVWPDSDTTTVCQDNSILISTYIHSVMLWKISIQILKWNLVVAYCIEFLIEKYH